MKHWKFANRFAIHHVLSVNLSGPAQWSQRCACWRVNFPDWIPRCKYNNIWCILIYEGFIPKSENLSIQIMSVHLCSTYCDSSVVDCSKGYCVGINLCLCNEDSTQLLKVISELASMYQNPPVWDCDALTTSLTAIQPECICETPKTCPVITCPASVLMILLQFLLMLQRYRVSRKSRLNFGRLLK